MRKHIERRLDNLERLAESRNADYCTCPRSLDSYFRALENFNREKVGLPPLPYTEEDRRDDEEFLLETLPVYRASPGWQTVEAQHALDIWERDTIERLQKGA
jgi:hypothetical protein